MMGDKAMQFRRCRHLNEFTEVKIKQCVFSRDDILMMYIDRGGSIEELGTVLGIGRKRANKLLDKFNVPKSQVAEMSPRRLRVLRYVAFHQKKYNNSPTIKEIAEKLELPPCTVVYHIQKLNYLGFLQKKKHHRPITITDKGRRWCGNADAFVISGVEEESDE